MIKNVLFDLDGTLLPMDQDKFLELYMISLYKYFPDEYKDIYEMIEIIKKGIYLMVTNNGETTNEKVFYNYFKSVKGERTDDLLSKYMEYYASDFVAAKASTSLNPLSNLIIKTLKEKGYNIILATNPTIEGETTALYIEKILEQYNITISRLAYGLPMGAQLDYADELTLTRAFEGRKIIRKE